MKSIKTFYTILKYFRFTDHFANILFIEFKKFRIFCNYLIYVKHFFNHTKYNDYYQLNIY